MKKKQTPLDVPDMCANCRFFIESSNGSDPDECHEGPRKYIVGEDESGSVDGLWVFPIAYPDDWCGRHKRKLQS